MAREGESAMQAAARALGLGVTVALLAVLPLNAQPWSFSIRGAWIEQSSDGSDGSFRTQTNLDEGFLLEDFELRFDKEGTQLDLRAWGFGDAEPSQGADLTWKTGKDWTLDLEYRRNESFFQLAETELGLRQDDWSLTRWRSRLTWTGWSAAKLSLALRHVERSGVITQPFRALNDSYLLGIDLDEQRQEASLRLETRTLPVKLIFEQSFAQLERRNRTFAASPLNLDGDDPDLFADAASDRREDRDLPVSRLALAWGSERVEVTGAFLWSPAELDVLGESSTTFDLDGGRVGRVQFADDLLGSASLDAVVGHLNVGIGLAPSWTLRLRGDYRDRAQDATLLGNRILRLTNTLGDAVEIPQPLDETTFFDTTDTSTRVEIEHRHDRWTVWAGVFDATREVDSQRDSDEPATDVERDTEGVLVGVAYHLGRRLKASVEYEHGSFERFVFRTDPETADRFTAKLKSSLGNGWQLRFTGRFEEADNPAAQSSLDRSSESLGAGLYWNSQDGRSDYGLDLDLVDLTTETGLVFPDGSAGLSRYDLSLLSFGTHGRTEFGKVKLSGDLQWLEDDGDTWPLTAWNARARLAFATSATTEVAVFGQFWSYDEDLAGGDDFEVTRYGVAFAWRTQ